MKGVQTDELKDFVCKSWKKFNKKKWQILYSSFVWRFWKVKKSQRNGSTKNPTSDA